MYEQYLGGHYCSPSKLLTTEAILEARTKADCLKFIRRLYRKRQGNCVGACP